MQTRQIARCEHADSLKTISQHITSTITNKIVPCCLKSITILLKQAEKQLRFFPTNKKQCLNSRINKPFQGEIQHCRLHLLNQDTILCAVCFEDDKSENDFVDWVQCCSCQTWLHMKCASCGSAILIITFALLVSLQAPWVNYFALTPLYFVVKCNYLWTCELQMYVISIFQIQSCKYVLMTLVQWRKLSHPIFV